MFIFNVNDKIITDSSGNVGIGTIPTSAFDAPASKAAAVAFAPPSGSSALRVNVEGMFRYNTDLSKYEVFFLGAWTPFSLTPAISSVSPQVLRNINDAVTVTGSSFDVTAQWRFIGTSKRAYVPKTVTYLNDSNVALVRPDILPAGDGPYQIQCRQTGKLAYYSAVSAGSNPYFVTSGGTVGSISGSNTYTSLNPAAIIIARDELSGGIQSIELSGGTSLPAGMIGTFTTSGIDGSFIITGTTPDVQNNTTYPFSLKTMDNGSNVATQTFIIEITPKSDVISNGLVLYLDMNKTESYSTGTTWTDMSPMLRNFTFSGTPSIITESTKNNLKAFVTSSGTNGYATGPASNTFGVTNTTGYTIFYLAKTNNKTTNGAFKFRGTGHTTSANLERAIFVHPTWNETNAVLYFDQGGCCNSDSRTEVNINSYWNKYTIYALRCNVSASERTIWADGTLLVTNTNTPANINMSSGAAQIGGNTSPDPYYWDANLSIFIMYNRPLSDAEIISTSNSFKQKYNL